MTSPALPRNGVCFDWHCIVPRRLLPAVMPINGKSLRIIIIIIEHWSSPNVTNHCSDPVVDKAHIWQWPWHRADETRLRLRGRRGGVEVLGCAHAFDFGRQLTRKSDVGGPCWCFFVAISPTIGLLESFR